ncbi:Transamidase GatB domain protein [hydrothermal vent metagenome]|uniref:Transamidase GatB domain protein n=1 Tax=hydrothermal vent metagenome TaxID=652676 RepID=A0A3B0U0T8_9ZZZZ
MGLRDDINETLKTAIKSQQKRRVATLRLVNAAIKDRDIAARTTGTGEGVDDGQVLDILAKMVKQRRESEKIYEEAGRAELATQEAEEIEIIQEFMPKQLSEDEMRAAVAEIVGEIEAKSLKDMGRTMAALKERYAGRMDFSKAGAMVKDVLG